jgi:hypothetical protein
MPGGMDERGVAIRFPNEEGRIKYDDYSFYLGKQGPSDEEQRRFISVLQIKHVTVNDLSNILDILKGNKLQGIA